MEPISEIDTSARVETARRQVQKEGNFKWVCLDCDDAAQTS